MDEYLELEAILNEMDFSKGHQEVVWEKIKFRIENHAITTSSSKDDAGCEGSTCDAEASQSCRKDKRLPLHKEN